MTPFFRPCFVNEPLGDPGVYLDLTFERRAILFDLGDISPLSARSILNISDAFVTHTHMDHFCGFDRMLRICLGRPRRLNIYGPAGFIEQLTHKIGAYSWNLVPNYDTDFTVAAHEIRSLDSMEVVEFHGQKAFQAEPQGVRTITDGIILHEEAFCVRTTILDHGIPCLAFSAEEHQHINIWKNKAEDMGLPVGPWLNDLKQAIRRGDADDAPFRVWWEEEGQEKERLLTLRELRSEIVRIVPGQKIAYVTDAGMSDENAREIVDLAEGADTLFIEAGFVQADEALAQARWHLTGRRAGELARRAAAKKLETFHYSARYGPDGGAVREEAERAFYERG